MFGLLFAGWWVQVSPAIPLAWSSRSGLLWLGGPLWREVHANLYYPILALTLLGLAAAVAFAQPNWVRFRRFSRVLVDGTTALILFQALRGYREPIRSLWGTLETLMQRPEGPGPLHVSLDLTMALGLLVVASACALSATVNAIKGLTKT